MTEKGRSTRGWVATVRVTDLNRALSFYRDPPGVIQRNENRTFGWVELGLGEPMGRIELRLIQNQIPAGAEPNPASIVLDGDGRPAFARRLKQAGTRIAHELERRPGGALGMDPLAPEGNELEAGVDPDHYQWDRQRRLRGS